MKNRKIRHTFRRRHHTKTLHPTRNEVWHPKLQRMVVKPINRGSGAGVQRALRRESQRGS